MQLNVHDEAFTFAVGSINAYMDKAANCSSFDVAIGKLWNVAIQDGPRRFVHSIAALCLFCNHFFSVLCIHFKGKSSLVYPRASTSSNHCRANMVNVRNAASPGFGRGTPGKRKRSDVDDDGGNGAGSSRRRYDHIVQPSHSPDRHRTPSAGPHVRFPRSLIMGPHQSDPHRRSVSPTRSALHKRDDPSDGPSAQLHAENDASQNNAAAPRLIPSNRTPDPHRQLSSTRRATQRQANTTDCLDTGSKSASPSARKGSGTRSRMSADDIDDDTDDPLARYDSTLGKKEAVSSTSTSVQPNDEEICCQMNDLRSAATEFAKTCPRVPSNHKLYMLDHLLVRENEQLIRYVGCLAMGGPTGEQGWVTLLADTTCRQALVLGIIGRALKENVFNELYFGGSERLVENLSKMEQEQTHQDGKTDSTFSC